MAARRDHPATEARGAGRGPGGGARGPGTRVARPASTKSADCGSASCEGGSGPRDPLPPSGPGACRAFGLELLLRGSISSFDPAEGRAPPAPFSRAKKPASGPQLSSAFAPSARTVRWASGWGRAERCWGGREEPGRGYFGSFFAGEPLVSCLVPPRLPLCYWE